MSAERAEPIEEADRLAELAHRLHVHFRRASKRYRPPALEDCFPIAYRLLHLDDARGAMPDAVEKLAGEFLGELNRIKSTLEATGDPESCEHAGLIEQQLEILDQEIFVAWHLVVTRPRAPDKLRYAEQLMLSIPRADQCHTRTLPSRGPHLLAAYGCGEHRTQPLKFIAQTAQLAWEYANDGKYPESFEPNAPVCKFLVAALREIGWAPSASQVSAILYGRARWLFRERWRIKN